MRHIVKLTLYNWGPFSGAHTLDLSPTVYAVVAQHEDDPERSNWIGKTWFLSSILYALTGQRPESCNSEDELITRGESEMRIELMADDGTLISRSRKRGKSTQLEVRIAGGKPQKQKVAQDNLYTAMGLDTNDLLATSFVRQKQIARLILADPSERTSIVNGWVELDPLQRAEDWLREGYQKLLKEARILVLGQEPEGSLDECQTRLDQATTDLGNLVTERDEMQGDVTKMVSRVADWRSHERNVRDLDSLRVEGKELALETSKYDAPDLEALGRDVRDADITKSRTKDRKDELKRFVCGDWDGKCPLMGSNCPEESAVRDLGTKMMKQLSAVEVMLVDADQAVRSAQTLHRGASLADRNHSQNQERLLQLRNRAQQLLPSAVYIDDNEAPPSADEQRDIFDYINERIMNFRRDIDTLTRLIQEHEEYAATSGKIKIRQAELEGLMRTHREAMSIVGKSGAQREVAEGALAKIQRGANALLQKSGIDLTVEVKWSREGKGLATHCDACGSAHPKSQRVTECQSCGVTRGPKLIEKLQILPSDRSGAADDICGLAFQLAASSWLRNKRAASWSSTCIDEPFGALDVANSRALGTHLHSMIRGNYAFDQGFLVAHDAQVMESLPARIQIYGGADGAVVEVIE